MFTLTQEQFRSVASVAHAASTDDVTPVLEHVKISVDNNTLIAVSSDRYRIAMVTIPNVEHIAFEVLVPAKALLKLGTDAKRAKSSVQIELIGDGVETSGRENMGAVRYDGLLVTVGSSTTELKPIANVFNGNYPQVERIMDDVEKREQNGATGVMLNSTFLATLVKLFAPGDDWRKPDMVFTFQFATQDGSKPQPVLAVRESDAGSVKYLVQPSWKLR